LFVFSYCSEEIHVKDPNRKAFKPTTSVINANGDAVAWDTIEEAVRIAGPGDSKRKLTMMEAGEKFLIPYSAIYARARRYGWKVVNGTKRNLAKREAAKADWVMRGEAQRELAFRLGHDSMKKFKPRAPKTFRELETADRIARRAAGLETAEVVQQTLVNINEAIEGHAEGQVIEASEVDNIEPVDQAGAIEDASADHTENNDDPIEVGVS
jgi:hypothetical protein